MVSPVLSMKPKTFFFLDNNRRISERHSAASTTTATTDQNNFLEQPLLRDPHQILFLLLSKLKQINFYSPEFIRKSIVFCFLAEELIHSNFRNLNQNQKKKLATISTAPHVLLTFSTKIATHLTASACALSANSDIFLLASSCKRS